MILKMFYSERSTKINKTRLYKMSERNKCIESCKVDTKNKIKQEYSDKSSARYKDTLKLLIIQGMIKLLEPEVHLQVREQDVDLAKSMIKECENMFKEFMLKETKRDYVTKLFVYEDRHLTNEKGGECGGVILTNTDRRIVCINTIESRLSQCFEELLPEIRRLLFPQ